MNDFLKGTNLYLIGMMGAGKTTLGKHLAQELGYRFFDTDSVIEQVAQQSIPDLFAAEGESGFRALETQVLAELSAYTRLAIATGGGIVLRQQNWSYLRHGIIVWLDVPLSELHRRLQEDQHRPLLQTSEQAPEQAPDLSLRLQTLMDQRQALYAQADVQVSYIPNESLNQLAARAIEHIRQRLKPIDEPDYGN
ncbi:shikimate kinase [Phormidium sp. CLA17]|uniref:shikimate kinase n=1 Tax=Leptolyngbya sp. Cla-17 TaxID=2803751 RepID=UPI001491715F|nr:shikimate kinase [Leptolyngbya sp. Cla-17]MBM0740473.1 shikimate kinase [Leptolyngbya sp. Cla-17]